MYLFCLQPDGELHIIEELNADIIISLCGKVLPDTKRANILAADDAIKNGCLSCFEAMDNLYISKIKKDPRVMKNTSDIRIKNLLINRDFKFMKYKIYSYRTDHKIMHLLDKD